MRGFALCAEAKRSGSASSQYTSALSLFSRRVLLVAEGALTHHQPFIALDTLQHLWFLDAPLADIGHDLISNGCLLGRLRDGPSRGPIRGELFEEGSRDVGGLPRHGKQEMIFSVTSNEDRRRAREVPHLKTRLFCTSDSHIPSKDDGTCQCRFGGRRRRH